jgi:hypothetical protein
MVAAARCAQIFDPPGSVTLWRLTDPLEERLETLWEATRTIAARWPAQLFDIGGNASTATATGWRQLDER